MGRVRERERERERERMSVDRREQLILRQSREDWDRNVTAMRVPSAFFIVEHKLSNDPTFGKKDGFCLTMSATDFVLLSLAICVTNTIVR